MLNISIYSSDFYQQFKEDRSSAELDIRYRYSSFLVILSKLGCPVNHYVYLNSTIYFWLQTALQLADDLPESCG